MKIHNNITGTIGRTPLVRLNRLAEGCNAKILVKLESFNPCGSVKDRIAVNMIRRVITSYSIHYTKLYDMFDDKKSVNFQQSYPDEWKKVSSEKSGQFENERGLFTFKTIYVITSYSIHYTKLYEGRTTKRR